MRNKKRLGVYAGSFDPVTYGHLDIIARAARIVDKLVLGVGTHHGKMPLIDAETRVKLLLVIMFVLFGAGLGLISIAPLYVK